MDDNYSLWERRERDAERWLSRRPVCCECDQHIQDSTFFDFDGEPICRDCLIQNHQKFTDDFIS